MKLNPNAYSDLQKKKTVPISQQNAKKDFKIINVGNVSDFE